MKVLNFGSLNIDHTYYVNDFVQKGQTITAKGLADFIGGKGLNQSISLSRAGTEVYHIGAIGLDGDLLSKTLEDNAINTTYLQRLEALSGHTIIQIDTGGDNCIIVHGGTNRMLDGDFIDSVFEDFKDEKTVVLLQNEVSNVPYIIEKAHADGHKIVLNPSPIDDILLGSPLEFIDCFILNESEGFALTGEKDSKAILDKMQKLYPNAKVVLTLGEAGSIAMNQDDRIEQNAFKAEKVVDTTGAGDTFTGYFLNEVLNGGTYAEALEKASLASSISVGVDGAVNSIPTIQNVKEKLAEVNKSDK